MLAAIPHAVLTVDANECVAFANPTAESLLRTTLGTATGISLHGAFETIAPDGGRMCALCAALSEASLLSGHATLVAGERRIVFDYECAPIVSGGSRVGVVIALDAQPSDAEIERRNKERVARETQAIIADLAHELNNPLTVVLASAGMMREHADTDDARRRLELIVEAAERCVGIVRTFRSSLVTGAGAEMATVPPPSPVPVASTPPSRRAQILVVDDDPLVASAMAAALAAEGHAVDIAADGLAALARVAARTYDVILTDVRMPRLDGPGFYHELRRLRPELLPRVVFVTGDTLSPTTRNFLASVDAPSVRKPFEPRQLRAVVRRVLSSEEARDIA